MKRLIAIFLLAAMMLMLACCTEEKEPTHENGAATIGSVSIGETKILIAYFTAAENSDVDAVSSASVVTVDGEAKGCVQAIADFIQSGTDGELFSIQTEFDYPGNIGALIDYADGEQERKERPKLSTHIENLDEYDVIFIGYPNWWYDMPMAMYTFFEEYDFTGKTIVPFNTHRGSQFSSTISTIQSLEPGATVITEGFTFPGDNAADAADEVAAWLKEIGF